MVDSNPPPKHTIGTAIQSPENGKPGSIYRYDHVSDKYTLLYNDGTTHIVNADLVEAYIAAATTPEPPVIASTTSTSTEHTNGTIDIDMHERCDESDPQAIMGLPVARIVRNYDKSDEKIYSGFVTSYFQEDRKYRLVFAEDLFEDVTELQAVKAVERAQQVTSDEGDKSLGITRKRKRLEEELEPMRWDTDDDMTSSEEWPVLEPSKFVSRSMAYKVVRKTLTSVLSQNAVRKFRSDKQAAALMNPDLKDKKALERFVNAEGLVCLQKALVLWLRSPSTHQAALLILKLMATLPSVMSDHIQQANMSQTLKNIMRAGSVSTIIPQAVAEMAAYILKNWEKKLKSTALGHQSTTSLINAHSLQTLPAISEAQTRIYVNKRSGRRLVELEERTKQLRALLHGKASTEDVHVVNETKEKGKLGAEHDRVRMRRKTILLDTLASRINRDHDDVSTSEKQTEEDAGVHSVWAADAGEEHVAGTIQFSRPQILLYRQRTKVVKLLEAPNSKPKDDDGEMDESLPVPNKDMVPKKSILKRREEEVMPAQQVLWTSAAYS